MYCQEKAVFIEGDDFHTPENINKMGRGQPLTDQVGYLNVPIQSLQLTAGQKAMARGSK